MNQVEQKAAARNFITRWQAAEGNEDREARSFWIELAGEVLGIQNPTHVLDFERRIKGRKCDVFFEDQRILVENKSRGVSLDEVRHTDKYGDETPFQQALWYHQNLGSLVKPYWLVTCNFDELRIYDMREALPSEDDYVSLRLEELPDKLHLLAFFTDVRQSRIYVEKELSVKAAELVGKLYDELSKQYEDIETDENEQRSLNVVIVRLVFLLYAEDAGLLQQHQAFLEYMKQFDAAHSRKALKDLFDVLDTPIAERDRYLDEDLAAFPYVNGGLFADGDIIIPQITEQIRVDLLAEASAGFDWSGISPTIFGAAFESTLNPETRRAGGMHYTTIEYIHRVIDPLFLDDLKDELAAIEGERVQKTREMKLRMFQRKLASIKIFDPAMGSGNFLTESYISLRKLENRVLEDLNGTQAVLGFGAAANDTIMVNIGQLYGIEINDFAVSVAKTALWIAEAQAMEETQQIVFQVFEFLPLRSISNLAHGNALRMDWNDVCPADDAVRLAGNPPFIGYSNLNEFQKEDRLAILGQGSGFLDYVACWYKKAADYMRLFPGMRAALVSTNSICQGQQVDLLWKPLFDDGVHIDFAYRSFVWNNETMNQASVHVVIVGFSRGEFGPRLVFDGDTISAVDNINGYLAAAPDVFIKKRSKPLSDVVEMAAGFKPAEHGYLLLTAEERADMVEAEPQSARWIRPFSMGKEFIDGTERFCLWLAEASKQDIEASPMIKERVDGCREWRLAQTKTGDAYRYADRPHLFKVCNYFVDAPYVAVPAVSSERRDYVPIGFVDNGMIPGNQLYFISNAGLYEFGIMTSQFQNAWMRTVAGRLKSDYRYSNTIVYNSFVWPEPSEAQRADVESCAQGVLDAREEHLGKTLADLYDPDKMPADLLAAHKALDAAVERAYGVDFQGDEEKIVAHLFKLYADKTADEVNRG